MFKAALSLSCVSGSLKGTVKKPSEIVYAFINDTDKTTAQCLLQLSLTPVQCS